MNYPVSSDNIDIGYTTLNTNGIEIRICHYLSNLDNNQSNGIFKIKKEKYLKKLYNDHADGINEIFRNHFKINDNNFNVKLIDNDAEINKTSLNDKSFSKDMNVTNIEDNCSDDEKTSIEMNRVSRSTTTKL